MAIRSFSAAWTGYLVAINANDGKVDLGKARGKPVRRLLDYWGASRRQSFGHRRDLGRRVQNARVSCRL